MNYYLKVPSKWDQFNLITILITLSLIKSSGFNCTYIHFMSVFQSLLTSSLSESDLSQMFLKDSLADNDENVFDVFGVGGTSEMVVHTFLFLSMNLKTIDWKKLRLGRLIE